MARHKKEMRRWRFTIDGMMFAIAGIGVSITLFKNAPAGIVTGGIFLGGTIGGIIGSVYYGTDEASETGFLIGAMLAIAAVALMLLAWIGLR